MTTLRLLLAAAAFSLTGASAFAEQKTAILAGGCFWCVEHDIAKLPGVTDVVSGYSGGTRAKPTYDNYHDVDAENPVPHVEVVQVTYDPAKLSYKALIGYHLQHIDVTDGGGQFCDRGPAYRPVIFTADKAERKTAEAELKAAEAALAQPVAVDVLPAAAFWPAEDYHQNYAEVNPTRYSYYRWNCGRDQRVEQLWGPVLKGAGG
jgi:peptide-methionine (S)-S-oxide reductase